MYLSHQIEPVSTGPLLSCFRLAVDETILVRSMKKSRAVIRDLKAEGPFSDRLIHFKKEIRRLENELDEVRSLANRKQIVIEPDKN